MNCRNFNKLARLAPKLLHCRVSLTYFVKNHEIFTSYLEENITSAWRHELYTVNVMCVNSILVCAFVYPFFILLNYFKFKVFLKLKLF